MNLSYHVPQLGKISTTLYPLAEKTFKLLEYYGHIDRMRKISQLGVIRNVYEGAHHSRWEYVMLQLSLIHKLSIERGETGSKLSSGLGLGSSNIQFRGQKPTGADILQMWTLLFNAGHLPGTFATEKAILRKCKTETVLNRTISTGLASRERIREYFKVIVDMEDIYSLHKVLISFHLERYRRHKLNRGNLIGLLQEVIEFYLFEDQNHRERRRNLRMLYHKIRQISYLFFRLPIWTYTH